MSEETNPQTSNPVKTAAKKNTRKTRKPRPFPSLVFDNALVLAEAIQTHAAGQKVRRLTLFDKLGKSPDSGSTRGLIIASNQYGLTKGSYSADFLELTDLGQLVTSPEVDERSKAKAKIEASVLTIPAFKGLFEAFVGNRLPSKEVLADKLREMEIDDNFLKEGVSNFILNAQSVGLLAEIAGAERLVPVDQALEGLSSTASGPPVGENEGGTSVQVNNMAGAAAVGQSSSNDHDFNKICFYVTPIGGDESEQRKHSDLFLGSLVEPAVEEFGLKVIRADKIEKPGVITSQILEYLLKAKLVIADLSFHNPNVFYELSLRHAARLPVVQIARKLDKIPFDIDQFRTIQIDTTDIYSLVPRIPTYQAAIANQIRSALSDPDSVGSPIAVYYPNLRLSF